MDFVVQGYSGSVDIPASSNVEVVDLGMGNETEDWDVASNGVGLVWLRDGEDGRLERKATRSDEEGSGKRPQRIDHCKF